MPYISRVKIDTKNRNKIYDLNNLGAFHGWVESCFPDEFKEHIRTRKLWRIENLKNDIYLLLVSQSKPEISVLEKYGEKGTAKIKDYGKYLDSVKKGNVYRFKAVLNPSYRESATRKMRPLVTDERQIEYLVSKASKNGFILRSVEISEKSFTRLKRKKKNIDLLQVTFEGMLEVRNSELFKKALTDGIGKERAFGCGMMTII